jgi:hypothetical protein
LDDVDFECRSALIKLDVEGYEAEVLAGAVAFLSRLRPLIIFESNPGVGGGRAEVARFLFRHGYLIHRLPWNCDIAQRPLDLEQLSHSSESNFIAVPEQQRING